MRRMTPRATLRPMPAFAAVLRPGDSAVTGGGGGVEANVVVGVEVGEDEDMVAAGIEVDHVVAGRPDLWRCPRLAFAFCI